MMQNTIEGNYLPNLKLAELLGESIARLTTVIEERTRSGLGEKKRMIDGGSEEYRGRERRTALKRT